MFESLGVGGDVARALRDALGRKDEAELGRLVGELAVPSATADLLLALPGLQGGAEVIRRAAALVQNSRSERAVAGLAEVHRLLTAYGLGEAVLLDLAEVRGFDYYSGVNFEGYVEGFGAELVGGGRYDQMLGPLRHALSGHRVRVRREPRSSSPSRPRVSSPRRPGPEFFVIDFTEDKGTALALCRRLRELGLAAARDIMSRPLAESLAYARDIRAARAVVIEHAGLARGEVRVVDLASGQETAVPARGAHGRARPRARAGARRRPCLTS